VAVGRTIRQFENKVKINTQTTPSDQFSKPIEIHCQSKSHARTLALALAGIVQDLSRKEKYQKLQSHPWYGQVIFQELTEHDRQLISILIEKTDSLSNEQFRITVQKLFVDDQLRPKNHAVIQEVLSLCN
jgi:hypothetical protein